MSSSNLIQRLYGADESSVGEAGITQSARRTVMRFRAGEAITAKDAVSLDLSQSDDGDKAMVVTQTDTGTPADSCFIGIALTTASAAGAFIDVVTAGVAEANTAASAVGKMLVIGGTAGRLQDIADGATEMQQHCAIACEAHSGNVSTVIVLGQGL